MSSHTMVWVKCKCELSVKIMTLCDYIMNCTRYVARNCVNDKFYSVWIKVIVISLEVLCQFLWSDWGKEQKKSGCLFFGCPFETTKAGLLAIDFGIQWYSWDGSIFQRDAFQNFAAAWFRSLIFCVIVQRSLVCYGRFAAICYCKSSVTSQPGLGNNTEYFQSSFSLWCF